MTARNEVDLIAAQVRAIESWNRARGAALRAKEVAGLSREMRMDLSRRMDVLREQHQAIVTRTEEHMRKSVHVLQSRPARRAVVVHRNTWFTDRVCDGLLAGGVEVIARLDNGAHAIGCVVAEQPDLLLVEDVLSMVPGVEVVRDVREFAPDTLIGAHVEHEARIGELLDAGAHVAWTRRVPPAAVTQGLLVLSNGDLQGV